jgi:hypothetical protein
MLVRLDRRQQFGGGCLLEAGGLDTRKLDACRSPDRDDFGTVAKLPCAVVDRDRV